MESVFKSPIFLSHILLLKDQADRRMWDRKIGEIFVYLNPPKNTPSIAAGLGGDEFGIGALRPRLITVTTPAKMI